MNAEDALDQKQEEIYRLDFWDRINGEMKQEKADPQEIMLRKICLKEAMEDFPEERDEDWVECRWEDLQEEKIIAQDARGSFNQKQEEIDREDFRDYINEEKNQEKVEPPEVFDPLQDEKKQEICLLKGFDTNEELKKIKEVIDIRSQHYMIRHYSNIKQEEVNPTGIPEDLHHDLQQGKINAENTLDQLHREQKEIDPQEFCDHLNGEMKQEKADPQEIMLRKNCLKEAMEDFPEERDDGWVECRWEDLQEEKIVAQDARGSFNQKQEEIDCEDFRDHINEEKNQEKVEPPEVFDLLQDEKKQEICLLKSFDTNEELKKIKEVIDIRSKHYMIRHYSNIKQEEINPTGIPEDLHHDLQEEKINAEDTLDQEQEEIDRHEFCDNLNEEIKQEKFDLKEMLLRRIFLPEQSDEEDWELNSNLSAEHNSQEKMSCKDIILIIFMVFFVIVYVDLKISNDPKYRKDALSSSLTSINDTELIRHVMVHLWSMDNCKERIQNQSSHFLISKLNTTNLEILSNLAKFSKDQSLLKAIDSLKMNEIRKKNWYRNLKTIVTWVKRTYHQAI